MFGKFFVLPYKGYNVIFYNNRLIKFLGHDLQTQDEKLSLSTCLKIA